MADTAPSRFGPAWVWLIGLLIVGIGIVLLIDWVGSDGPATAGGVQPGAEVSPDSVEEPRPTGAVPRSRRSSTAARPCRSAR